MIGIEVGVLRKIYNVSFPGGGFAQVFILPGLLEPVAAGFDAGPDHPLGVVFLLEAPL